MNKKLLSAALAAALAVPAGSAMAIDGAKGSTVQLYGRFQLEWNNVSSNSRNSNTDPLAVVDDNMGRWGIFAQEKLGNGITAFGRLEFKVNTSETTETARDRYLGVKGKWGLFLAGRHGSPYKITGGVKADPFVATTFEARNGGGMSSGAFGHTSFASDIFAYASPNWNGFSFIVAVNPENDDQNGDVSGFWSAGAQYKNGPIWVWGAYSDQGGLESSMGDDKKRWKLGAKGTMGAHSLTVQYENAKGYEESLTGFGPLRKGTGMKTLGSGDDARFWWVAYIYKAGNNTLMLSYGDESYDNVDQGDYAYPNYYKDGSVRTYTIAARHNFSKTFSVFGGWKRFDTDAMNVGDDQYNYYYNTSKKDPTVNSVSVGFRKDFSI